MDYCLKMLVCKKRLYLPYLPKVEKTRLHNRIHLAIKFQTTINFYAQIQDRLFLDLEFDLSQLKVGHQTYLGQTL